MIFGLFITLYTLVELRLDYSVGAIVFVCVIQDCIIAVLIGYWRYYFYCIFGVVSMHMDSFA